jgi:hypothetical protein
MNREEVGFDIGDVGEVDEEERKERFSWKRNFHACK